MNMAIAQGKILLENSCRISLARLSSSCRRGLRLSATADHAPSSTRCGSIGASLSLCKLLIAGNNNKDRSRVGAFTCRSLDLFGLVVRAKARVRVSRVRNKLIDED